MPETNPVLEPFLANEEKIGIKRASISKPVSIQGIGVHSGKKVRLKIQPANIGTGVRFRRQKHHRYEDIILSPDAVVATTNAVSISNGKWHVQTVEHLLAAFYAIGISDAIIELDSSEIPIMDGSAEPFYKAITKAGVKHSNVPWPSLRLHAPVWVVDGDRYLIALPQDEEKQRYLSVTYNISYNHPLLYQQSMCIDIHREQLAKLILPARTFAMLSDVEALKEKNLALGGSLDNAIVLNDKGYINKSLRYPDECIRHKILDLIGDLYLLGQPLEAHIIASKAGHALDVALVNKITKTMQSNELSNYHNIHQKEN